MTEKPSGIVPEIDLSGWAGDRVMLCADDFAISDGVSQAIAELAQMRRLSATSAIVNLPGWRARAPLLRQLSAHILPGLHLNLTLGPPLRPMPRLAPDGTLPPIGELTRAALTRRLPLDEIEAEIIAQIEVYGEEMGRPPNFIDGHQHVHALPQIRTAFVKALARYRGHGMWIRDPSDRFVGIVKRGVAVPKALLVHGLSQGFGAAVRAAGFATNNGFSGFSDFDSRNSYAAEFARFFATTGPRHLIMCHPGYADAELGQLDPVTTRRQDELETLKRSVDLAQRIWLPERPATAYSNGKAVE